MTVQKFHLRQANGLQLAGSSTCHRFLSWFVMACVAGGSALGTSFATNSVAALAGSCAYYGQPYSNSLFASSRGQSDDYIHHLFDGATNNISSLSAVSASIKTMDPWVEFENDLGSFSTAWVMLAGTGYAQDGWFQYQNSTAGSSQYLEWSSDGVNFNRILMGHLTTGSTHAWKVQYDSTQGLYTFLMDGSSLYQAFVNFTPTNAEIYAEMLTKKSQQAGDTSQLEIFSQAAIWNPTQTSFLSGGVAPSVTNPQWAGEWDDGQSQIETADMACGAQTAFNWYDSASAGFGSDDFHIVDELGVGSNVAAELPSRSGTSGGLPWCPGCYLSNGGHTNGNFSGQLGGPLRIGGSAGNLLASQRVKWYQSFSEINGQQDRLASTRLYFDWYDNTGSFTTDNIHIINLGGAPSSGLIELLAPTYRWISFNVNGGSSGYYSFPAGSSGGPVVITVTNGGPGVFASQRVQLGTSGFNELNGLSSFNSASTLWFSWYDKASPGFTDDNVHVTNIGSTVTDVTVSGVGQSCVIHGLGLNQASYCSLPAGTWGGPITVSASNGGQILATQRVKYYNSFAEFPAMCCVSGAQYFSWYDRTGGFSADDLIITNPNLSTVSVTVSIPGYASQNLNVQAGHSSPVSFAPGTLGGPITIQASNPIFASERTTYYSSFHEVNDLADP